MNDIKKLLYDVISSLPSPPSWVDTCTVPNNFPNLSCDARQDLLPSPVFPHPPPRLYLSLPYISTKIWKLIQFCFMPYHKSEAGLGSSADDNNLPVCCKYRKWRITKRVQLEGRTPGWQGRVARRRCSFIFVAEKTFISIADHAFLLLDAALYIM